jgi:6-phosphogluconolactonase/glucosamine-6-phosphate isomerase/deaminase
LSAAQSSLKRRTFHENIWFSRSAPSEAGPLDATAFEIRPEVLQSENAVGAAMLAELDRVAASKEGDIVIILLGGRGAQAMHRLLGARAVESKGRDRLLPRLRVFTQDALAPMRMGSGLSFVRDFERLLGPAFFEQIGSFESFRTDAPDLESEASRYVALLEEAGGADIFFLGHGPEANAASHLAYIKPYSGATRDDVAGLMPISMSILDHHITKFKAGGSNVADEDVAECRKASHIFTLGPAAILDAKLIVQSIVDASTAPAKKQTYRRVLEAELSRNPVELARQLDENPGLWIRLHPHVRSFILPDVLE